MTKESEAIQIKRLKTKRLQNIVEELFFVVCFIVMFGAIPAIAIWDSCCG